MPKKRRRFVASQKTAIVLEVLKEEKSIAEIVAENGIHPNQIHKWKKQALANFSQCSRMNIRAKKPRKLSTRNNWTTSRLPSSMGL